MTARRVSYWVLSACVLVGAPSALGQQERLRVTWKADLPVPSRIKEGAQVGEDFRFKGCSDTFIEDKDGLFVMGSLAAPDYGSAGLIYYLDTEHIPRAMHYLEEYVANGLPGIDKSAYIGTECTVEKVEVVDRGPRGVSLETRWKLRSTRIERGGPCAVKACFYVRTKGPGWIDEKDVVICHFQWDRGTAIDGDSGLPLWEVYGHGVQPEVMKPVEDAVPGVLISGGSARCRDARTGGLLWRTPESERYEAFSLEKDELWAVTKDARVHRWRISDGVRLPVAEGWVMRRDPWFLDVAEDTLLMGRPSATSTHGTGFWTVHVLRLPALTSIWSGDVGTGQGHTFWQDGAIWVVEPHRVTGIRYADGTRETLEIDEELDTITGRPTATENGFRLLVLAKNVRVLCLEMDAAGKTDTPAEN